MGIKEGLGKGLKALGSVIPGVSTYLEKDGLREADKKVRMAVSASLMEMVEVMDRRKTALAKAGKLDKLKDMDDLARRFETQARELEFAARGYAAFFDNDQVGEKELRKLHEHDLELVRSVEALMPKVERMESVPEEEIAALSTELEADLREISRMYKKRAESLRPL